MQGVAVALSHYSPADVLALSKADLKDLLGPQQGIRLHVRIAQQKAQMDLARKSTTAQPPFTASSSHSSSSSSSLPSSVHRSPVPSRYGQCSVRGCSHPGIAVCSVVECGSSVCVWHEVKSLFTGHVYCPQCEKDTWEGKMRAAYVNAADTADKATAQIIDTTAEWTAHGRDALTGHSQQQPLHHSSSSSLNHSTTSSHGVPIEGMGSYHGIGSAGVGSGGGAHVEEKQQTVGGRGGGGGAAKGLFFSDGLRGGDDGEESDELSEGLYKENSWNGTGQGQCSVQ